MNIIREIDLTYIEKEALRMFLALKQDNSPLLLVGAQKLANQIEVSRPRAHAILSKLVEKNMLIKIDRKGFTPSDYGNRLLDELQHRTKILEVFCHEDLGMSIEGATVEASQLVLNVSYEFIEVLCAKLGKPVSCPHNIAIPHHKQH